MTDYDRAGEPQEPAQAPTPVRGPIYLETPEQRTAREAREAGQRLLAQQNPGRVPVRPVRPGPAQPPGVQPAQPAPGAPPRPVAQVDHTPLVSHTGRNLTNPELTTLRTSRANGPLKWDVQVPEPGAKQVTMTMSDDGMKELAQYEGSGANLYNDNAGLPTIGIGHLVDLNHRRQGVCGRVEGL